jgi:hypothetical protein
MNDIIKSMVEFGTAAQFAHCRIKEWKLSKWDALTLAMQTAPPGCSWNDIYENMKAGNCHILGARLRVI